MNLGSASITALYLGSTAISTVYLGATQVYSAGGAFTPASLFASGEEGAWYEPSPTTCFTDTTASTAATYGDPVAFLLDKSQGAGYADGSFTGIGSELVTNGTFDTDVSGWTGDSGASVSWNSGRLSVNAAGSDAFFAGRQALTVEVGKCYFVSVDVVDLGSTSEGARVIVRDDSTNVAYWDENPITATGTYTTVFTATDTDVEILLAGRNDGGPAASVLFDNISVRELPGNHATQTTFESRPILARVPEGGRRNLLERTEEFDNAYWGASNGTLTSSSFADNGGGDNARFFSAAIPAISAGGTYTFSIEVAPNGYDWIKLRLAPDANFSGVWFNVTTGSKGTEDSGYTGLIESAGDGYYKCTVSVSSYPAGANPRVGLSLVDGDGVSTSSSTSSGVFIRKAQAEAGSTATAYQKVVDEYDITEAGVTSLDYLSFDGADDGMATASIDFTSTDEMSVFAGVEKSIDQTSCLAELSADWNTNAGSFQNFVTPSGFDAASRGTATAGTAGFASVSAPSEPFSAVLAVTHDISGDLTSFRLNGASPTTSTGDKGAGNFGNYPLYIGRRGGTTLPFDGHIYGLIVRGASSTTEEITNTEAYLAAKSGATL